jgi:hypothetical protein
LDEFRANLDLRAVVLRLIREGYFEGAARHAIAKIRLSPGREVAMAEVLVLARRELASMQDAKLPR